MSGFDLLPGDELVGDAKTGPLVECTIYKPHIHRGRRYEGDDLPARITVRPDQYERLKAAGKLGPAEAPKPRSRRRSSR